MNGSFKLIVDPCLTDKLVFTDGAYSNNGRPSATYEIGIVVSRISKDRGRIPIDDSIDPGCPRTSQRAELESIHGLTEIHKEEIEMTLRDGKHRQFLYKTDVNLTFHAYPLDRPQFVIVTDSNYVVVRMTTWLPRWKVCDTTSSFMIV